MKKILIILVIGSVVLGLVGISQAKPTYQQIKPIPASNINIVKKIPITDEITKGKPTSPSGKEKGYSGAATGTLGAEATGNKYAVVIGICDYPGTGLDLCQSDGDSLHMYKALTTLYGYKPENVKLLKDGGGTTGQTLSNVVYGIPTRENIYNAVMDIKNKAIAGDEVVFFFSGHGANGTAMDEDSEVTDESIVVWNNEADVEDNITYIWDGELKDWFNGFNATRIVFVFDSCLAGGMNDVADTGRVVNMAAEESKSAYVYSTAGEDVDENGIKDGEGVFSRYFANEGMLQGLADGSNALQATDTIVAVEEAFDYAKAHIPAYLKSRQKPVISDNFALDLPL